MPAYTTPLLIMLFLTTSTLLPMDLGLKNISMIDIRVMAAQEAALLCRRLRCFLVLAPQASATALGLALALGAGLALG